jgi:hypothetical protein
MESSLPKRLSKPGRKQDAVLMGRIQPEWVILAKPRGSSLSASQLSGSRAACASFDPDLPGAYEFEFTLKTHGSKYYEHVKVLVMDRNNPFARRLADQADPCYLIVWKSFLHEKPNAARKAAKQIDEQKRTVASHAHGDASDASVNDDSDDEQDESQEESEDNDAY